MTQDLRPLANAIRALSMDAVEAAQSGHPGMPMGMADVATVLYSKFLKFDPSNPTWADRDRVILSGGHGSMLLYALNYLTGYEEITLDAIKNFRQLGSICDGHPEYHPSAGIETTTGPLGQGIATAVGFALAERHLNAKYGDDLVNHYTYVMCGDGDLMEGISHEACSMAGHWGLDKLIVLYDDNNICIDGSTDMSFTDDTVKRFESYGWNTDVVDGHNYDDIESAIAAAQNSNKPTIICCKTHIGYGAPTKQDTAGAHGAPLGADEIAGARKNLDWPHAPFEIPSDILGKWRKIGNQSYQKQLDWNERLNASPKKAKFEKQMSGEFDIADIIQDLKGEFSSEKPKHATRKTSGLCLEKLVPAIPGLLGGSADLTGSVNTKVKVSDILDKDNYGGQYIHYGVREHGMAAAMNGLAQHGGIIPYAGTFMVFTDYCRPSIRLSSLMKQRVIYVMTHDSIGLGEDGPTHQPVEHLSTLRAMPNLYTFRPCDGVETAEAWEWAINKQDAPTILSLTRQGVPTLCEARTENMSAKGAYILKENSSDPEVTLFGTGSELSIAAEAYEELAAEGVRVRLVSAPCLDLFIENAKANSEHFTNIVCNSSIKIAVEAGIRQSWDGIIGAHNPFIGMNSFGASAPADKLYKHFGITKEAVLAAARTKLEKKKAA